jgi:hypothetical protein
MMFGNVQHTEPSSPRSLSRWGLGWVHLAAALAAGLAFRLVFVHFYGQTSGDSLIYGDIAKNLLQHGVYGMTGGDNPPPTLIRLPGYPLFLAACFRVFGMEHYTAVMLVQCVAGRALPIYRKLRGDAADGDAEPLLHRTRLLRAGTVASGSA